LGTALISRSPGRGIARLHWPPRWATLTLAAFCLAEVVLLGYARTTSGLAHLRAAQELTQPSAGGAAAACAEANAALGDFSPLLPLLNVGRVLPFPAARAWGEVPRLAEALGNACQSIEVYAEIAPWPDASIDQGAAVDLLADVRRQRSRLVTAGEQVARAWSLVDSVDATVLAAEPRLERVARLLSTARAQQADVSDALALAAPDRIETLFGGRGPRALVLALADGQAFAVIEEGRIVSIDVGEPTVSPIGVISVDRAGLGPLVAAVGVANASQMADGSAARLLLQQIVQLRISDNARVAAALKQSAELHQAWVWFEDPALLALARRRGWVRQ
jgi:hypothetical protein